MPINAIVPEKPLQSSAPYSSKIIKAGALIGDTKTLLSHWDVDASVDENINRMQRDNVFGKASRSRVEDILAIFRQRYLTEESVTKALVTLVRGRFPTANLERPVCYGCYRSLLAYIFSFSTQARRIPETQASPSARVIALFCRTGSFRLGLLGLHFVKPCRWGSALYLKSSISL